MKNYFWVATLVLLQLTSLLTGAVLVSPSNANSSIQKTERRLITREETRKTIMKYFEEKDYDTDPTNAYLGVWKDGFEVLRIVDVPDYKKRTGFFTIRFENQTTLASKMKMMTKSVGLNPLINEDMLLAILERNVPDFVTNYEEFMGKQAHIAEIQAFLIDYLKEKIQKTPNVRVEESEDLSHTQILGDEHYPQMEIEIYPLNQLYLQIEIRIGSSEYSIRILKFFDSGQEKSLREFMMEVMTEGFSKKDQIVNYPFILQSLVEVISQTCPISMETFPFTAGDISVSGRLSEEECKPLGETEIVLTFYDMRQFKALHVLVDNEYLSNEYFLAAENQGPLKISLLEIVVETKEQVERIRKSVDNRDRDKIDLQSITANIDEASEGKLDKREDEDKPQVDYYLNGKLCIRVKELREGGEEAESFKVVFRNVIMHSQNSSVSKEFILNPLNGYHQMPVFEDSLVSFLSFLGIGKQLEDDLSQHTVIQDNNSQAIRSVQMEDEFGSRTQTPKLQNTGITDHNQEIDISTSLKTKSPVKQDLSRKTGQLSQQSLQKSIPGNLSKKTGQLSQQSLRKSNPVNLSRETQSVKDIQTPKLKSNTTGVKNNKPETALNRNFSRILRTGEVHEEKNEVLGKDEDEDQRIYEELTEMNRVTKRKIRL